MKQFVFAKGYAPDTDYNVSLVKADNGCHNLVLQRPNEKGGNVLFPIYAKDLTCAVSKPYAAAVTYTAAFTIPEIVPYLDYTVTFIKKGKQFNERNKWSAVIHARATDDATTIASKIAKFVEDNETTLGLTATAADAVVTVTAVKAGEDYAITFGDELYGVKLDSETAGTPAWMDAPMVKDLAAKCAADAGFEYTYDDFDIYPGIEFNPLAQADTADTGFVVYSIRFTEPRVMATRDDAVYQMIHVAFPTGAGSELKTALTELGAKIVEEAAATDAAAVEEEDAE